MRDGLTLDLDARTDLGGRVCLVTGATSGHGLAVARALAALGGEVVLLGRDPDRCRRVQRKIRRECGREPEVLLCDLSSLAEVRRAAEGWLSQERPLHVLVNNAGLVSLRRQQTADGLELGFGVNYLAHFLLTRLLLGRLRQTADLEAGAAGWWGGARVVNVSSDTHRITSLDLDDLQSRRRYSLMRAYGRSKLAIVHFTLELARRLAGSGITVNAVDPGPVESRIGQNHPGLAPRALAVVMRLTFPSAERAARTAVRLASAPEVEGRSGGYYKFGRQRRPGVGHDEPQVSRRLWEISEGLAGG